MITSYGREIAVLIYSWIFHLYYFEGWFFVN